MFHSKQASVSVIFLNGLSSDLLGHISLIKLNADMSSPLGGIVSSTVMKGSGGRGQPMWWTVKISWAWL